MLGSCVQGQLWWAQLCNLGSSCCENSWQKSPPGQLSAWELCSGWGPCSWSSPELHCRCDGLALVLSWASPCLSSLIFWLDLRPASPLQTCPAVSELWLTLAAATGPALFILFWFCGNGPLSQGHPSARLAIISAPCSPSLAEQPYCSVSLIKL